MATEKTELYTQGTNVGPFGRWEPSVVQPKRFGDIADVAVPAAPATILVGTPVVFDDATTGWRVWQDADANTITGFVYPDPVVLHATNDVLGNVMLGGQLHYDDAVLPDSQTQGTFDTAMANLGPRFAVQGLADSN